MFHVNTDEVTALTLKLGKTADYGASPWYTEDIRIGANTLKLSPDSGANFIWATSDLCHTDACNNHQKVNTGQPGFHWIDKTPTTRSFGPWGSMTTETGAAAFSTPGLASETMSFFASTKYSGGQFKYLAWDGGIGFPATTKGVEPGSGFYFGSLYAQGAIKRPSFSVTTDPRFKSGVMYLGGDNENLYRPETVIELQPDTTGAINYIWGTPLYGVSIGKQDIPSLTNARFYLDTGSSLFKGDDIYLLPILQQLYALTDASGARIFSKVYDDQNQWVSLVYNNNKGPNDFPGRLPDLTITIGQACSGKLGKSARITLSPFQYSYFVEQGERSGSWVPAFAVLNGVGGLLVGSTFMDLLYTRFDYVDQGNGLLTQGNMYLYQKRSGTVPKNISCVPTPSPIAGTWVNSYCSQVSLTVADSGEVHGIYTSHTGSTGSSLVRGWLSNAAINENKQSLPVNPEGTPLALAIQWRLINEPLSKADGSWNWVSTFSGQFHPDQIVHSPGQKDYSISQRLNILNGLLATSTLAGLADTAPKMWPQDLTFTRIPPSYCELITPPEPVPFHSETKDYVSGIWRNDLGDQMIIRADMMTSVVKGVYTSREGKRSSIVGLLDAVGSAKNSSYVEQGVALALKDEESGHVWSLAGGVDLPAGDTMTTWVDSITTTTWTNRFMESTLDKTRWKKASM